MTADERTALNREIAELMGWRHKRTGDERYEDCREASVDHWHTDDGIAYCLPDFAASLDALRDGPEAVLRKAFYIPAVELFVDVDGVEDWYFRWIPTRTVQHEFPLIGRGRATTEALARARAVAKALSALREATP